FLFLSVTWMVWDDYDREWKTTQRRFSNLELQVTQAQLQQASRSVDRAKLQQMQAQREGAEKNVAANRAKVDELQAKLNEADNKLLRATLDMQYMKATYDQDRYDFEASRAAGTGNVARKQQIAEEEAKKLDDLELARQKAEAEKAEIQKQLGQYTGQAATLSKQIEDTNAEQTRLRKRLDVIAPSVVKDYVRNAPLLDFMAPTIKIQQIILPDVVDDVNFIRVPKMDRCQTCHLAIDKKGYEKYPEPFTTHPNLETFLGSSSPHPIDRVGCTVCNKTRGFDTNMRKPGPILTKIDSKLSLDWVKNWIRNPRAVKPTTWMPRFFYNSNNSSPEDAVRNEVEIDAIVSYLFANTEKYEPAVKDPPHGDAKNGEQIVKSIGCQGCHVVGEGKRSEIGPR